VSTPKMLSLTAVTALSLTYKPSLHPSNNHALHPSPRRVAVKNVAYEASESKVARVLSIFGEVEAVELAKVHHGRQHGRQHHGYGWVTFATEEAATMAAAAAAGDVRLHGRDVFVKMADVHHPRSERKRTHDVPAESRARTMSIAPTLLARASDILEADREREEREQMLQQLQAATDVDEIEAVIAQIGELRSAEEFAIARFALQRSVIAAAAAQKEVAAKVDKGQPVTADEYRKAKFDI